MQSLIKITIFLLFLNSIQALGLNKNELLNSLQSKYKSINQVYLEFSNINNPDIIGTITAKKGNNYKIDYFGRIIYCNGKTIWNYSKNDNKVLISNYKDLQNISLESLFFKELNDSKAIELNKVNSNDKEKSWELKLKNSKTEFEYVLYLNENKDITSIKFTEIDQEWKILKIDLKNSSEESFEFKVTEKMEVIDLR